MLVEETTEQNYKEKNEEGRLRVANKIKKWQQEGGTGELGMTPLFDPTLWAYQLLKDKQENPLILRGFQDKIINDRHRFIIVAAANQAGKSWMACAKAVHHALHVNNASVLIISKSDKQAIYLLDEIKWMLKRADKGFKEVMSDIENRTEIHIQSPNRTGVSVIRCLPPTTSVLAYSATLIICDEQGFWEVKSGEKDMSDTRFFYQCVETRTNETKNWKHSYFTMGQIVVISNPNGQRGIFWHLWNTDSRFHKYRYCWLANPRNTLEEYLDAKARLPSDVFDSSYAAVFSSARGGFITLDEYNDSLRSDFKMVMPNNSESIYIGGDFAGEDTKFRDVDESVLFGVTRKNIKGSQVPDIKVVYYKEFPKRSSKSKVIYPELKRLRDGYSIAKFGYDKMGVGDSVKNDMMDMGLFPENCIEPLTYSLPNKSEVYYNMKHLFEQRRLILPDIPKLKEQLMGLRFERTTAGHMTPVIKVHHASGGIKDDYADALANALYMATRFGDGTTVETIPTNDGRGRERKSRQPRTAIMCKGCGMNKYSSNPKSGYCDECS